MSELKDVQYADHWVYKDYYKKLKDPYYFNPIDLRKLVHIYESIVKLNLKPYKKSGELTEKKIRDIKSHAMETVIKCITSGGKDWELATIKFYSDYVDE